MWACVTILSMPITGTVLCDSTNHWCQNNITIVNHVCRFVVDMFYCGTIVLRHLNMPMSKPWGNVPRAQHPLMMGITALVLSTIFAFFAFSSWEYLLTLMCWNKKWHVLKEFVVTIHSRLCKQCIKLLSRMASGSDFPCPCALWQQTPLHPVLIP